MQHQIRYRFNLQVQGTGDRDVLGALMCRIPLLYLLSGAQHMRKKRSLLILSLKKKQREREKTQRYRTRLNRSARLVNEFMLVFITITSHLIFGTLYNSC